MAEFDECFYDFLRAMAKDELADLKRYLQNALGWIDHDLDEIKYRISRLDDWLVTIEQEISRLEHKVEDYADRYGVMPFVDFLDCVGVGGMAEDMRSLVEGYVDKYFDFKYKLINTTSVQTYMNKLEKYTNELSSRTSEYIEVIDGIIAEKL